MIEKEVLGLFMVVELLRMKMWMVLGDFFVERWKGWGWWMSCFEKNGMVKLWFLWKMMELLGSFL